MNSMSKKKFAFFSQQVSNTATSLKCKRSVTKLFYEDILLDLKYLYKADTFSVLRAPTKFLHLSLCFEL
jgi:hypothetical protein